MRILVTGGTGYIGSHTCVSLLEAGFTPIIVDNLSNSKPAVLDRLAQITGRDLTFYQGDIRDQPLMESILADEKIEAVIHFAGLKAVGESVSIPLAYYENNVGGTVSLLKAMDKTAVRSIVFSSSATVYGDPAQLPIPETAPLSATNPYGRTKLFIEEILRDLAVADPRWSLVILRYFNPVGAHPSGLIGEDPQDIPNNLMPFVAQVAVGRREKLSVFGGDYPTRDGTGVRDYIHVVDLAEGHVAALKTHARQAGVFTYNLGTGNGSSVLEIVAAFAQASGRPVPYQITDRRPGDVAQCYADPTLARDKLGWQATRDLTAMTADAWRWQSANPSGYDA
ncbi:MAG: UDP-glucose 4-epimerase GalE [Planctomycetaceae bacterium]|nr:UDP-glucose 4-epimerase GalE [Planctomycetaceae bacterium]